MVNKTTTIMFQGESSVVQPLSKAQRFLLELVTVLFFIVKNTLIPVVQQYVYFLVDKKYNFTNQKQALLDDEPLSEAVKAVEDGEGVKHHVSIQDLRALQQLDHTVNEESSFMVLYLNIAELLPSAIIVLLLGAYSDTIGKRKFLMWLPCLGNALYALGFVLPLYVSDGDIDSVMTKSLFIAAALCSGIFGNVPTFFSGIASYISDTDTPFRRTLRLSIVELIIGLTFGISNFVHGFWIKATDHFEQPLWFLWVVSILTFIIIFFFLQDPPGLRGSESEAKRPSIGNLQSIKQLFKFSSSQNKKLWFIFTAYMLFIFVQQGQERTYVLFLKNPPLHYTAFQIGSFFLITYVLGGLASWPGVPLLHKWVDDRTVTILGLLSKIAGSLIMAFASGALILYVASIAQMFHLVPFAVARSIASQQVGDDEQGSVYALLHSAQAVVGFLGPLVHNAIFASTLRWMSGFVFLVSGPLLVLPVSLLLYMKYLDKDAMGYTFMDEESLPTDTKSPGSVSPRSETTNFGPQQNEYTDGFGATSKKTVTTPNGSK